MQIKSSKELLVCIHTNQIQSMFVSILLILCLQCTMTKGHQFFCNFSLLEITWIAKIEDYLLINILDFFGQMTHGWRDVCVNFTLIGAKFFKILLSLVAYWATLLVTCPKHASSKGWSKFSASHELINLKARMMFANVTRIHGFSSNPTWLPCPFWLKTFSG